MRKIVLIFLILFFLQNCGKKGNPEYQGIKKEFNNIINLKT